MEVQQSGGKEGENVNWRLSRIEEELEKLDIELAVNAAGEQDVLNGGGGGVTRKDSVKKSPSVVVVAASPERQAPTQNDEPQIVIKRYSAYGPAKRRSSKSRPKSEVSSTRSKAGREKQDSEKHRPKSVITEEDSKQQRRKSEGQIIIYPKLASPAKSKRVKQTTPPPDVSRETSPSPPATVAEVTMETKIPPPPPLPVNLIKIVTPVVSMESKPPPSSMEKPRVTMTTEKPVAMTTQQEKIVGVTQQEKLHPLTGQNDSNRGSSVNSEHTRPLSVQSNDSGTHSELSVESRPVSVISAAESYNSSSGRAGQTVNCSQTPSEAGRTVSTVQTFQPRPVSSGSTQDGPLPQPASPAKPIVVQPESIATKKAHHEHSEVVPIVLQADPSRRLSTQDQPIYCKVSITPNSDKPTEVDTAAEAVKKITDKYDSLDKVKPFIENNIFYGDKGGCNLQDLPLPDPPAFVLEGDYDDPDYADYQECLPPPPPEIDLEEEVITAMPDEKTGPQALTEHEIFQVEMFYRSHKTDVYVCPTLVNLYFGNLETKATEVQEWKIARTGIPVLLLNTGESHRKRRLQIVLAEKGTGFVLWKDHINHLTAFKCPHPNFHTLHLSTDHTKMAGFSYDDISAAQDFQRKFELLTSDPDDEILHLSSSGKKKKNKKKEPKMPKPTKPKKYKAPVKAEISQPCGFTHISRVDRSEGEHIKNLTNIAPPSTPTKSDRRESTA